jgi:hypothetical protein
MALSRSVLMLVLSGGVTLSALGQQPADATKPASQAPATAPSSAATPTSATPAPAAATQAPAAPAGPSADLILRAKNLGLTPKTKNGVTKYCKKDVPVGTRFPTETCYHEDELQQQVAIMEYRKDQMRKGSNQ